MTQINHWLGSITPNQISTVRIVLAPVVCWLLAQQSGTCLIIALIILAVADLTDGLDGYVARRFKKGTEFGGIYDPLCDSFLHGSVFITLSACYHLPLLVTLIMFWRDLTVAYMRVTAAAKGRIMRARMSGKLKAVFQIIFIYVFIIYAYVEWTDALTVLWQLQAVRIACWVTGVLAVGMTVWSFIDYAFSNALNVLTDRSVL